LSKLAEFLVAEEVVDINHEDLRVLLRGEGITFQRLKVPPGILQQESRQLQAEGKKGQPGCAANQLPCRDCAARPAAAHERGDHQRFQRIRLRC
jgi:hypothetical protein